jgi:hypothetical protein
LPDDPSEPTRLQTELRTAAVGARLQAGRRLVKRLDSAVQKAFSEEADADGRIDLPAEF